MPKEHETTYQGYTIRFNPHPDLWNFSVVGLDSYPSLDEAKQAIDRKVEEKKITAKQRLEIKVLDRDGDAYTVTGINVASHYLVSKPVLTNQGYGTKVYPTKRLFGMRLPRSIAWRARPSVTGT